MLFDSLLVCGATAIAERGVVAVGLFKRAWGGAYQMRNHGWLVKSLVSRLMQVW